ncbi:MAG: efflux RND transporter periplasmic adaptor subunit, partial [Pseudomonadota bacterium]|nr:efflux RND transporter periplasmic adaptor subunit [Pseudomonadota bacterium]
MEHLVKRSRALRIAVLAVASIGSVTGCAPKPDNHAQAASMAARNVTLTAAQLRRIRLYTVASSKFRKTIEAAGVVDFDNDHATSVLAPFSGPVSRLLVSLGDAVKKGEPLAAVD